MGQSGGKFRLELLGPFGLFAPNGSRVEITSRKAVALIALLALAPRGTRTRGWLREMLWETRSEPQAQGSLRRELSTLGKVLEAHGGAHLIARDHSRVTLDLDALDVDVLSLGAGLGGIAGGDFLEGIDLPDCEGFEDWLREQRSRCADLAALSLPEAGPTPSAQQVLGEPLPPTLDILSPKAPGLPPKPSVAILPFKTFAGETDAWLGGAVAEEIELLLTRYQTLFVVSSGSASALAARDMTTVEIARQLGVRYLLDGNVRIDGSAVRITVTLLDGLTGGQLWAHVFTSNFDGLFALQEEIAREVAPRINTRIDAFEIHSGLSGAPKSGDSYRLYWRANALFRKWEKAATLEAIELCDQLLELEPTSPWVAAMAAFCHGSAYAAAWTDDREATKRAAMTHYQNAMRGGGDDPTILGYAAGTLVSIGGDLDVADRLIARALGMMPAYQPTLFWGGWVDVANGNPARARERFELSLRINPEAGVRAYAITGIGIALLLEGDFARAYTMLSDAYQYIPTYPMTAAALGVAAAMTGDRDTAKRCAATLHAAGGLDQVLSILRNPEHRTMLSLALNSLEPA
jgi:TolB-like protein